MPASNNGTLCPPSEGECAGIVRGIGGGEGNSWKMPSPEPPRRGGHGEAIYELLSSPVFAMEGVFVLDVF